MKGVSVVIPARNMQATIARTLDSLCIQEIDLPVEVIVVDNASTDDTVVIARQHPIGRKWPLRVIVKEHVSSLSSSYNQGWKTASFNYVVLMHSDCYVTNSDALSKMVSPMMEDEAVVAVQSRTTVPVGEWGRLGFWDRVSAARYMGHESHAFGGRFDGLRRSAMAEIGGFDAERFFSAGEDVDLYVRLSAIGRIVPAEVRVVHGHEHPKDSTVKYMLRKQWQLGEGLGAIWRIHGWRLVRYGVLMFTCGHVVKALLLVLLVVPPVSLYAAVILLAMALAYSWRALLVPDWRIALMPFVNIAQFAAVVGGAVRGYVNGRQNFNYK